MIIRIMSLHLAIITAAFFCVMFQIRSSSGLTTLLRVPSIGRRHACRNSKHFLTMKLFLRRRSTTRLFVGDSSSLSAGGEENNSSNDDTLMEIQSLVGLSDKELDRIVSRIPQLRDVVIDVARNTVTKLQSRLSLTDLELKKKIVLRLPQCLGYAYESEIEPNLALLQTYPLRLSDEELTALVLKCPQIIGLDYELDIKPKIEFVVQESMGGGDAIDVAKSKILNKPASLNLPIRGAASKAGL